VSTLERFDARFGSRVNVLGLATMVAVVLVWQLADVLGLIRFDYIPAPTEVASAFGDVVSTGALQENLAHTLTAAIGGWAIAVAIAVPLGVVIGLVRPVWVMTMASLDALRALPIVGFVPVAVLLYGFTMQMEIYVAAYAAVWPLLINTVAGMRAVKPRSLEVAQMMQFGALRTFWTIRLPGATPYVVTGMRLGLSLSLVLTLVAEIVGNPSGVGFALTRAGQSLQPATMFAYIISIGIAGIVLNAILMTLARLCFRGQLAAAGEDQP
jgi:ABC-type nitrate/sulfonate/bicarbonate transport system permease component